MVRLAQPTTLSVLILSATIPAVSSSDHIHEDKMYLRYAHSFTKHGPDSSPSSRTPSRTQSWTEEKLAVEDGVEAVGGGWHFPHFGPKVEEGISFSWTLNQIPDKSSFNLVFDGDHCKDKDNYGDNDCHYKWGETVEGHYVADVSTALTADDVIEGKFKIDRIIPYDFSCKVCGEPCVLHVPVINEDRTFNMPPCPVDPRTVKNKVEEKIKGSSPTDGTVKTHLEGTVTVKNGDGESLIEVTISAFVK